MSPSRQRLASFARIAAWLLVGGCAVLLARSLDWKQVRAALGTADLCLLVAAVLLGPAVHLFQGLRWHLLASAVRRMRFRTVWGALLSGNVASALLPLRAGEAVRVDLLGRASGAGRAVTLGTVALDHAVNGVAMFTLVALVPLALPTPWWMAALGAAGLVGISVLAALGARYALHPEQTAGHPGWRGVANRLRGGLAALRQPRRVVGALASAAGSWVVEIAIAALCLRAFHLPSTLGHAMLILVGVNLALAIPSPPANVGNFELGAGAALMAMGAPKEGAAAFALAYHLVQLFPTLLEGAVAWPWMRKLAARGQPAVMPLVPPLDAAAPVRA